MDPKSRIMRRSWSWRREKFGQNSTESCSLSIPEFELFREFCTAADGEADTSQQLANESNRPSPSTTRSPCVPHLVLSSAPILRNPAESLPHSGRSLQARDIMGLLVCFKTLLRMLISVRLLDLLANSFETCMCGM